MNDPLRIAKVALQKVKGLAQKAAHHAEYLQKAIEEAEAAQPDALPERGTRWIKKGAREPVEVLGIGIRYAPSGGALWFACSPEEFLRDFEPLPDEPEQAERKWVIRSHLAEAEHSCYLSHVQSSPDTSYRWADESEAKSMRTRHSLADARVWLDRVLADDERFCNLDRASYALEPAEEVAK